MAADEALGTFQPCAVAVMPGSYHVNISRQKN